MIRLVLLRTHLLILRDMKRSILIYGLALGIILMLLKAIEYRYLVRGFSIDVYMGIMAIGFTALGIWIARQMRSNETDPRATIMPDTESIEALGLSDRELDVLKLIAKGCSNQEIADQLYISIHTVKTHSSNLYSKLDVKRRTQAVTRAKELGLVH